MRPSPYPIPEQKKIRVYDEIDRDFIMDDFYAKMKHHFGEIK